MKLDQQTLEGIVEDGVKEMKARTNLTDTKSQKLIKRKVLAEIYKYRDSVVSDFLPVLVFDFEESIEVQFIGVKMNLEEENKLKNFISMMKKSDVKQYLLNLVNGLMKQDVDVYATKT